MCFEQVHFSKYRTPTQMQTLHRDQLQHLLPGYAGEGLVGCVWGDVEGANHLVELG